MIFKKSVRSAKLRDVQIHYRKRKTLLIRVLPEGEVELLVPIRTPLYAIEDLLTSRREWIAERRRYYQVCERLNKPPSYKEGAEILYLGQKYRLNIVTGPTNKIEVDRDNLSVQTAGAPREAVISKLITKWYRERAAEFFNSYVTRALPLLSNRNKHTPVVRQRKMKRLWGSCSSSGKITLNTELIKVPAACINYVIMHEMCHLVVMNHGKKFYRLLDELMPDWRVHRETLRTFSLR